MRERIVFIVWVLIIMLCVGDYTFKAGAQYGVEQYKRSSQFMRTLDSMYRFGLYDGRGECR